MSKARPSDPQTGAIHPPAEGIGQMNFESAMAALEEIVERIEAGTIGLEESVKQYEAGVKLVERCKLILGQAEQRIEELKIKSES